jgi:hypothetical protein
MIVPGTIESSEPKYIRDTFTRTTSGSLGYADTAQRWVATRGTWSANGSQAVSSDSSSTRPIATIPLNSNAIISADVTPGVGVVFWASDANNWWAAYPYYSASTTSSCTGPTVSCTDSNNTCSPGGCGTVTSTSSTSTSCTGPTVSCTDTTNTCNPGGCGAVTSTSSATSSSSCTGPTVSCSDTTNTCAPGGCGAVTSTSTSSTTCGGTLVSCSDTSNTCNPGGSPGCQIYVDPTPTSDCSGNTRTCTDTTDTCSPTQGYSDCPITSTITNTTCPNNTHYNGDFCANGMGYFVSWPTFTYTRTQNMPFAYVLYTRSQYDSTSTTTTYTRSQATTVGGSSTSYTRTQNTTQSSTSYTRTQATTVTTGSYNAGIIIDKSVAGVITNDSVTPLVTDGRSVASIQVVTSGNTVTAKGFEAANLNNQLAATITRNPTSPAKGSSVGIIKAPSSNQGSTLDNFVAK